MIGTIAKESTEREKRAKNIVIHGIVKSTSPDLNTQKQHDKNEIEKVFDLINADKGKSLGFFRIPDSSRDSTKKGPVIISLPNEADRNEVLKLSNEFFRITANREAHKTIFINPDMTAIEKNLAWQLRTECKVLNSTLPSTSTTVYVIRGNQIKEITKGAA